MNVQDIISDPEFIAKTPEVQQQILEQSDPDFATKDPAVKSAILTKIRSGSPRTEGVSQPPPDPVDANESIAQRISADFARRQQNVQGIYERSGETGLEKAFNVPRTATLAAGQAAGTIDDIVGELIISAWNTLAPDEFKSFMSEQIGDFSKTKLGQLGIEALSRGINSYELFSKTYPDAAKALESTLNFTALGLTNAARREAVNALSDVSAISAKTLTKVAPPAAALTGPFAKRISDRVRTSITKVIDLTGEGRRIPRQRVAYLDRAESAIKEITQNRANLQFVDFNGKIMPNRLPTNPDTALWDMTQAIDQTKKRIWPEVDAAMQTADAAGLKVNPRQAISNIREYISSPSILSKPDSEAIVKQGRKMIKYYENLDDLDVFTAREIIKDRNATLDKMKQFVSTSLSDTDKAGLYSAELSGLNDGFRRAIGPDATGALRRYGNLLEIESDFNNLIHTKVAGGGIDYASTFSAIEAMKVATGHAFNPSALGTAHVVSAMRKANRKAGKIVAGMFEEASKLYPETVPLKPVSVAPIAGAAVVTPIYGQNDFNSRLEKFQQSTGAIPAQ